MSAGLPYLQKLRKSDLTELAETSNLRDYAPMRKSELEVILDDHLRANQDTYRDDPFFGDYYKRLGPTSSTKSMIKTEASEKRPIRKKSKAAEEAVSGPDHGASITSKVSSMIKNPSTNSLSVAAHVPLPPSPAVVTDAIERQTAKIRRRVSGLYADSGIDQTSETFRHILSSSVTISVLALIIEAYSLRQEILPSKIAGYVPTVPKVTLEPTPVYLPDLFLLLNKSFWAPFSLWLTTSLFLPLSCAYFINISLKSNSHNRRRSRRNMVAPLSDSFDPFVYNLAKAFVSYIVYAQHCTIYGLFQHFTIATVSQSILGGHHGILIGAAIPGVLGLYEAILMQQ